MLQSIKATRSQYKVVIPRRRPSRTCDERATASQNLADPRTTRARPNTFCDVIKQVLALFVLVWLRNEVRGVIRTPLEAFRPSAEIHIRRPDKLPLLPHRRTMQQKSGLKILYQTGVSIVCNLYFY